MICGYKRISNHANSMHILVKPGRHEISWPQSDIAAHQADKHPKTNLWVALLILTKMAQLLTNQVVQIVNEHI